MKHIHKSGLLITALFTFSFTIISDSSVAKKKIPIANCYQSVSGSYLSVCASSVWLTLSCMNKIDLLNKALKNDISYSNFTTFKNCVGGAIICCIQFGSSGSIDPCFNVANEKKGDGILKDGSGNIIPGTDYVKVIAIECKNN